MRYTLILGSNLGDKIELLQKAINLLELKAGRLLESSTIYETEPWGFESENSFYNQVVVFESKLEPISFLNVCLDSEAILGRERKVNALGYASRMIDIDILFCDDLVYNSMTLVLPHPHIAQRRFVLEPLAELIPNFIHPVIGKSVSHLLSECKDMCKVTVL